MQSGERREIREYKEQVPVEARIQKAEELKKQRQNHCPLILLRAKGCRYPPPPPRYKPARYIVDGALQMGTFLYTIRKQMKLSKSDGLYLHVGETLPVLTSNIGEVYKNYADLDGFLYLVFSHEADKGSEAVRIVKV